jgi:hypothetical protein
MRFLSQGDTRGAGSACPRGRDPRAGPPLQIPEELIEPFAQRARREGVTLNSALNAALLLSLNRHLYAGQGLPMRTFAFANLRPYVEPPLTTEHLACYISMLRYTVHVEGDGDFWSMARELHAKIHSSFKSGDKFIASIMAEPLMKMVTGLKAFRMSAGALNYNGVVPVQTGYGESKCRRARICVRVRVSVPNYRPRRDSSTVNCSGILHIKKRI